MVNPKSQKMVSPSRRTLSSATLKKTLELNSSARLPAKPTTRPETVCVTNEFTLGYNFSYIFSGTTTASVLTLAIFEEGCEKVSAGLSPIDLWRGISKAVDVVVEDLKAQTRKIETKEQIKQVATVSANNDAHVGGLIADAMEKVGREGVITVESGKSIEDEIEVVEGMSFNQGFLSPSFLTDKKTQTCVC